MSIKVSRKEPTSKFLGLVVNKTVFFSAIAVIIFSVGFTLIFEEQAEHYFGIAQTAVSAHGGWIYTLAVNLFIVFCLYMAFSKFGGIRIGGKSAKPEFSLWAWFAILFSAGIGNGLVLFSIADPVRVFFKSAQISGPRTCADCAGSDKLLFFASRNSRLGYLFGSGTFFGVFYL